MDNKALVEYFESTYDNTVLGALGIRIVSYDPNAVCAAFDVDKRHLQPAGIVHGGVFVLLAETVASISASLNVDVTRYNVSGMEINANHLRPVTQGHIQAIATIVHRGKTTMVYSIAVTNEKNQLVSISRCTIAIRERAGGN